MFDFTTKHLIKTLYSVSGLLMGLSGGIVIAISVALFLVIFHKHHDEF
jgi:hypothetical protein